MPLTPGYGETAVPDDDLASLTPQALRLLGEPVRKMAIYDLEQAIEAQTSGGLLRLIIDGALDIDELITDHFLRELHRNLYGDLWIWAGQFRTRETNIGVAPEQIAVGLRSSLDSIRYRWQHTSDWTERELGIAVHAESVRIHPFVDGNGRVSRVLANLVFAAVQKTGEFLRQYDWELDKVRYIELLRKYDGSLDPRELAEFVSITPLSE